jgi:sugar phosphate isomerase/epimerase
MNMNRRQFLGSLSAAALAPAFGATAFAAGAAVPAIGVQLYMLKQSLAADLLGTLDAVAALGVTNLEFAGYYDHTAAQMKSVLADRGLNPVSSHCLMASMSDDKAKEMIDYGAELGLSTVVAAIPYMGLLAEGGSWDDAMRGVTRDDFMHSAERFNRFGELANAAGLQFAYHNHAFDFTQFDGACGLDILLENTDAGLVKFQLDVGNTAMAGIDPIAYFKAHASRVPSVHMKDWKKPFAPSLYDMPEPTPVGNGVLDLPRLVAALAKAGVGHMFIEQENMPRELELVALMANVGNLGAFAS